MHPRVGRVGLEIWEGLRCRRVEAELAQGPREVFGGSVPAEARPVVLGEQSRSSKRPGQPVCVAFPV